MKKIALLFILTAGLSQAKAQQVQLSLKPDLKLNDGLSQNTFKPNILLTPQQMLLQPQKNNGLNGQSNNGIVAYSKMSVAKLSSNDEMPAAMPPQGQTYTMLVKKVIVINPDAPVEKPLIP